MQDAEFSVRIHDNRDQRAMALLTFSAVLQDAVIRNIVSTLLVSLIAVATTRCITVFVSASGYRQFCKSDRTCK